MNPKQLAVTHQTYQHRAYTSPAGYARIAEVLRHNCDLYNGARLERMTAWRQSRKSRTFYDQCRELTNVRADDPDGYGSEAVSLSRGALKRVDRAYSAFYARCKRGEKPGHPRWKPYHRYRTLDVFGLSTGTVKRTGDQTRIKVVGLPTLRLRRGRHMPDGKPVALSITQRGRRVWVQVTYEVEKEPMDPTDRVVGLDMGVSDRVALSDGRRVERRRPKRDRVKQAQRRLSRCKKGSRRWKERRHVLSNRQHRQRVANRNEVHRLTTALVREHGVVVAEDLQIKNMTRSAKGTVDDPGRKVKAKSGLNRSINDQTWGMILTQLAYKAEWAGRQFVKVDPKHTSQTCSVCGVVKGTHRDGKDYDCSGCGSHMDADFNAARVILQRGLAAGNAPPASVRREKSDEDWRCVNLCQ